MSPAPPTQRETSPRWDMAVLQLRERSADVGAAHVGGGEHGVPARIGDAVALGGAVVLALGGVRLLVRRILLSGLVGLLPFPRLLALVSLLALSRALTLAGALAPTAEHLHELLDHLHDRILGRGRLRWLRR